MTTLIDLSHPLEQNMPLFPRSRPIMISQESTLAREGYNELTLCLSTHSGTHIDCGYHLLPGGSDTMTTPVDRFFGPGLVLDCRHRIPGNSITREFLYQHEQFISSSEFLLLHTGWCQFWGDIRYFQGFPVLTPDAAKYLTGFTLKGIGSDTISFDPVDSHDLPVHHAILDAGMILVENLLNLDNLPETGFMFCCFPLKIQKGDGSPVRAVGVVTSNK